MNHYETLPVLSNRATHFTKQGEDEEVRMK